MSNKARKSKSTELKSCAVFSSLFLSQEKKCLESLVECKQTLSASRSFWWQTRVPNKRSILSSRSRIKSRFTPSLRMAFMPIKENCRLQVSLRLCGPSLFPCCENKRTMSFINCNYRHVKTEYCSCSYQCYEMVFAGICGMKGHIIQWSCL